MQRIHRQFRRSILVATLAGSIAFSMAANAQVAEPVFPMEKAKEALSKEFSKRRYKPVQLVGFQTISPNQVTAYLAFTDEVGTTSVRFIELTTDKGKQWFMYMNDKEQTMIQVN